MEKSLFKKFALLGALLPALFLMSGCGGEDDPIEPGTPTDDEIVLADKNQSTLEFDAGASTQTVRFSTTQAWSAEVSSGDWCTVSPVSGSAGNGSITVSVSENTEEAERSATVTLKAGEASLDLEVTQSLTSFDVEEVAGYITEVTETVDELFMQSEGIAELSQSVEEIRSLDGVQDVSVTDDALYVEIKDGGIISWYYPPKSEPMDVNVVTNLLKKSLQTSMASTKGLASDHAYIEPQKFCIINQTANDESFASVASGLRALKNMYDDVFDIELIRGEEANLDFFASLTDFDFVFLETHGNYSNHQHWLATGETVTNETRQWLNSDAGRQWRNKSIGIMTLEETRKSKVVKTAYWAISEKFIESMHDSFDNTIIFSTACKSLKESNTLASAFQNKGAGIYVGYDETNAVGAQAGINFWGYMSWGMTVEQAIENIPDENKIDSEWGGVLHFYPQSNGNMCIVHPEVNTSDATNIGGTTATLQGEITGWIESLNADEAEAGFCWSKSLNPLVEDSRVKSQSVSKYQKKENTITLSEDIIELEPNTTYYYRAFLKMNGEYYYGDVKEFETGESDGMREFLVKLYHDTDGDNWERNDNWLSDKPITEWYGVSYIVDRVPSMELEYDFDYPDEGYCLDLDDNNLKGAVDLSGCPLIWSFSAEENELTSVDVSNCTSLCELLVRKNMDLEKIDISNTTITDLYCNDDYFPSLKTLIAENSKLHEFTCYSPLEVFQFSGGSVVVAKHGISCNEGAIIKLFDPLFNQLDLSGSKLGEVMFVNAQFSDLNLSGCQFLGEIHVSNSTITNLNVSNCQSIKGGIGVTDSEISNFDFSNCDGLEELLMSFDRSEISKLNLSGCDKLYSVSFDKQCAVSELNLSDCPNLNDVLIHKSCHLEALDVSRCIRLTSISLFPNNLLTTLDVSTCPNLVSLICSHNSLTSINASGCSKLKGIDCSFNSLTSLNVSGCSDLRDLDCSYNQLTDLDVSDCVNLEELDCMYNKITKEIPAAFKRLSLFYHDRRYEYHSNGTYTDNGVGWWYPGEPESGKHAWPDE